MADAVTESADAGWSSTMAMRLSRISAPREMNRMRPMFGPSGVMNGHTRPTCPLTITFCCPLGTSIMMVRNISIRESRFSASRMGLIPSEEASNGRRPVSRNSDTHLSTGSQDSAVASFHTRSDGASPRRGSIKSYSRSPTHLISALSSSSHEAMGNTTIFFPLISNIPSSSGCGMFSITRSTLSMRRVILQMYVSVVSALYASSGMREAINSGRLSLTKCL